MIRVGRILTRYNDISGGAAVANDEMDRGKCERERCGCVATVDHFLERIGFS